ncbi:hypothetical protein N7451_012562 [Penicillium sp. IBT 35674x]|nr:hypothetical protein N7451_012562 [Penicillium sp. IBT 35674x]
MAPNYHADRIHKEAFVVCVGFFLGLAVLGVVARFAMWLGTSPRNQRTPFRDQLWLLLVALLLALISCVIIFCKVVNPIYMVAGLQAGVARLDAPTREIDVVKMAEDCHRWVIISLMISWCSKCAVNFFFLAFFRRLIDRLRVWQAYWWIPFTANVVLLTFGITVYYVSCPYWGANALQCATGKYMSNLVRYSAAQIALDILVDLLILAIPIALILRIRMDPLQKVALSTSLCLTILLVLLSVVRIAGLKHNGQVDTIWETFWQTMSAESGVCLAAFSGFRVFFMPRRQKKAYISPDGIRSDASSQGTEIRIYPIARNLSSEAGAFFADRDPAIW